MTEYATHLTDADLTITDSARARIAGLVADTGGDAEAVRIYIAGGGCSGMNYGMTFAEQPEQTDRVMSGEGNGSGEFKLVVDPVAFSFLKGAEVDYVDDGVNASFVFNNVFQAIGGSGACGGCGGGAF